VFICGGTGVLPFMDIFSWMFRRGISKSDKKRMIFPDETFEL